MPAKSPIASSPLTSYPPLDEEKPRLSEHEKKANHIASEQKRRQAIRDGFDRLTEIVPGLEGQGRSESVVLKRTVEYMREQLDEKKVLEGRLERLERLEGDKNRNGNGGVAKKRNGRAKGAEEVSGFLGRESGDYGTSVYV